MDIDGNEINFSIGESNNNDDDSFEGTIIVNKVLS